MVKRINLLNCLAYKISIIAILLTIFSFSIASASDDKNTQQNDDPNSRLKSSKYINIGIPKELQEQKEKPKDKVENKDTTKLNKTKTKKKYKALKSYRTSNRPSLWFSDDGLRIATIEINNRKYVQAIDSLEKVIQRHPKNADAYSFMGYSYLQLGILDKAQKNLKYALKISPDHMGAHLYMGLLHLKNNKKALALESLQAIKLICKGMLCAEEEYLANKINLHEENKK